MNNIELFIKICCVVVAPLCVGCFVLPRQINWAIRWVFGLLSIGIFFLIAYVLALPFAPTALIFGVLICISLIRCVYTYRECLHKQGVMFKGNIGSMGKHNIANFIFYGCLLILFVCMVVQILANPILEWDGMVIWFAKAKAFYYWDRFSALPFPQYPSLGSMLWGLVLKIFGFHIMDGVLVYITTYILFMISAWNTMVKNKKSVFFAVVLVTLVISYLRKSLYSGYQDDFLSIIAGFAVLQFVFFIKDFSLKRNYLTACFFAGSLGLIKSEGVLLGFIIYISFLVSQLSLLKMRFTSGWRHFIIGTVICIGLLIFWTLSVSLHGIDASHIQGQNITFSSIAGAYKHWDRIPLIYSYLVVYYIANPISIWAILLSLIALFQSYLDSQSRRIVFILTILLFHIASIFLIFMSTNANLIWHLDVLTRLMNVLLILLSVQQIFTIKKGITRE